jgi:hypothetical protein
MLNLASARSKTHRDNIARYRRLLETRLTDFERQYIQRRLLEEQSELESLASAVTIAPDISAGGPISAAAASNSQTSDLEG